MKNNKGIGRFLQVIIFVPVLVLVTLLGTVGMFQIMDEYLISQVYDTSQDIANTTGVSSQYTDTMTQAKQNYDNVNLPFELFISLILIFAFIMSIWIASQSQPIPTFSFFGYSTLGMMVLLLIIVFLDQFIQWFLYDLFWVLFENNVSLTLLDWYINNLSLVSVIWFAILLFLNQVELNIERIFKRGESDNDLGGRPEE